MSADERYDDLLAKLADDRRGRESASAEATHAPAEACESRVAPCGAQHGAPNRYTKGPGMNRTLGASCLAGYIASIYMANWLLVHVGFVTVWPGVSAPAGVYAAGFALTFRDLTQTTLGRRWVVAAIIAGAALSYTVSVTFATASAIAFLASETADFAVFTPLEKRHWLGAILASNTVGLLVDSMLFLWLAFGSLAFLKGQVIGKVEATILAVALLGVIRAVARNQIAPRTA